MDELKHLSVHGFEWLLNCQLITLTVDLTCVCVDKVARAMIQNFMQFNGFFGCSWCDQPGVRCDGRHVYPYEENHTLRTKETVKAWATSAMALLYPVMGVKGFSILSELPCFDIAAGCLFDVLHGVDFGVVRQLDSLWFSPTNSTENWYLGGPETQQKITALLRKIKPPSNVKRLPRNMHSRAMWKATEWRNMLLSYGPYIFKGIMKKKYYKHFLLLSEAIYLLSQKRITQLELYAARRKLKTFVKRFEKYYGKTNMSFNVHQLLHACDCVGDWGPLWAYSLYIFEGMNGRLLEMFNGTQRIDIQITNRFQQIQVLEALTTYLADSHYEEGCEMEEFLRIEQQMLSSCVPTKKITRVNNVTLIGNGKEHSLSLYESTLSANLGLENKGLRFNRFIINKEIFTVSSYKRTAKRQNCYVMLSDGQLFEIVACYLLKQVSQPRKIPLILGQSLQVATLIPDNKKCQLVSVSGLGDISSIEPLSIVSKCVVLDVNPLKLSVLPNLLDRD